MHSDMPRGDGLSPRPSISSEGSGFSITHLNDKACGCDFGLSPALQAWQPGDMPAFEMKFVLDERRARQVESMLRPQLAADRYADPALDGAYRITTAYCDTQDFDIFHGTGDHHGQKYRLRRYDGEPRLFLECKIRKGDRVRKRRTPIEFSELMDFSRSAPRDNWPGNWFHHAVLDFQLKPVCSVQYLRTAYVGAAEGGPIRLTFDRSVRGSASSEWFPELRSESLPHLVDQVVCEFKFQGSMPAMFKAAIRDLQLAPGAASKYRRTVEAAGIAFKGSEFRA